MPAPRIVRVLRHGAQGEGARATLGMLAALALAAGCGSSAHHSASPTSASPTTASNGGSATTTTVPGAGSSTSGSASTSTAPAATATTTAPGPAPCTSAVLSASLGSSSGAAGSTYEPLIFTNRGSAACTLRGYPGAAWVAGGSGTQVGPAATEDATGPVVTVTLAPGGMASSLLRIVDPYAVPPAECDLTPVRGLRVYPPNQTAALFVTQSGQACASPVSGIDALSAQPVAAGSAG